MISINYSHIDMEADAEDFEQAYTFVERAIGAVDIAYESARTDFEINNSITLNSLNSPETAELTLEDY